MASETLTGSLSGAFTTALRSESDYAEMARRPLDAEGGVWIALWAGGALRRYAPDGRLDQVVTMPVTHPTKCAFGGPDLADLYVTSAWTALSPSERTAQPQAGGLFRYRPGVKGRPAHTYAG